MGIIIMLGVSMLAAGGKYLVRPDSRPVTTGGYAKKVEKTDNQRSGIHLMGRLHRFKRNKSIRSRFVRMKRKHFIR